MYMRVATELQEVLLRPAKYVFGGMYLEGLLGRTPSSTAILFLCSQGFACKTNWPIIGQVLPICPNVGSVRMN
jgi:hypothetical protein